MYNITKTEPVYVQKLIDRKLSRKEVAKIVGISDGYIGQCIKANCIRKSFEDLAKIYYERKFSEKPKTEEARIQKQYEKVPAVTLPKNEETVLMVVVANQNVDFLTRIVRSLKGEVTTV